MYYKTGGAHAFAGFFCLIILIKIQLKKPVLPVYLLNLMKGSQNLLRAIQQMEDNK